MNIDCDYFVDVVVKCTLLCVAAGSPQLHALHRLLPERPLCGLPGPPAARDSEPARGGDSGGAGQALTKPGSGEQGDTGQHSHLKLTLYCRRAASAT